MADQKISQLTGGGAAQATDEYVVARSGGNNKITGANVAAAATSVGTLTSLTVSGDLTVDTSTLKVDSTNNRVGVGTASPGTDLDVSNSTSVAARLTTSNAGGYTEFKLANTGTSGRTYEIGVGGNTSAYPGQFFVQDVTAGVNRLTLDSSGNLGLGVTPTNTSNYVKMQISGTSGGIVDLLAGSTRHLTMYCAAGSSTIGTVSNTPLVFQTNDATKMTLDASGNLGVGTTGPDRRLDVEESVAGQAGARINNTSTANGSGVETVVELYNNVNAMARVSSFRDTNELRINNIANGIASFYTNNTERARITSGGVFDVVSYVQADKFVADSGGIALDNGGTSTSIATNSTATFGALSYGIVQLVETGSSGDIGIVAVGAVTNAVLSQTSGNTFSATAGTAGKVNVYYSSGNVTIENKLASTAVVRVLVHKLQ